MEMEQALESRKSNVTLDYHKRKKLDSQTNKGLGVMVDPVLHRSGLYQLTVIANIQQ
jgi:hypothetical protein